MRSSGFRWTFSSAGAEATCGRFANGDYWVAPAPGAAGVTLESLDGSGRLSLDENPSVEANGLLGTSPAYGNHVASENLLGSLPRSFSGPTSLVAALQRDETASGRCGAASIAGNCLDAYDVLTILPAVPPGAGSLVLRPALDGSAKKLVAWSALDTGRIPRRTWFAGTGADGFEAIRQRWSHSIEILSMLTLDGRFFSEGGRAFRASAFLPDYAAGVAAQWHEDLMTVMSDAVHADDPGRRAAIAAMLVYGKDVFHAMYGPDGRRRNWGAGAGQWLGRFPAAAFFAAVSRDGSYARTLASAATDLLGHPDLRGPHELEQVNEGVNGPVWGDFPDRMSAFEVGGYWNEMLKAQCFEGAHGVCNVGIGKRTSRDPYGYIDGPPAQPGQGYMYVALGPQRALVATMFLMPEMCAIVNDDLLVAYVDRVQSHGISTAGDPCAPPDPREDPVACDAHVNRGCVYYGVTWGPDPAHPGQCIRNGKGRFPALDGVPGKVLYSSPQVESNWASIRATAPRCARAEFW